ncbi:MAG: rhomboid family intramembrane serine protease [Xanthomonadales bacterium]|nr:rhomboid family intramembrane serine protease [Xanthomonadales bacterium]
MLILPLHRPLTRATFPFVTAVLVLVNVLVFALAQGGDGARVEELGHWYAQSGLADLEWPAYQRFVATQGDAAEQEAATEVPAEARGTYLFHQRLMDVRLEAALRAAPVGAAGGEAERRAELEAEYTRRAGRIVTLSWLLRHSEVDPGRLLGHAFLHAGVMHLAGNMLFLIALGLLVEGALGEARFALLYLVGILGSAAFSLAWHWGDGGGGLGASGAIAALMGAFCVIWGRRPVRFFWWFFVVFDYVRKPAIWLLPAWIGWEALNLAFNADAGVGFDAHLGGLLAGALAGWVLARTGQVRHDFFEEIEEDRSVEELAEARRLLGRMDLAGAEARLAALAAQHAGNLEVAILRYRCASLAGNATLALERLLVLLSIPAADAAEAAEQYRAMEEGLAGRSVPRGAWRVGIYRRWMALRQYELVEALLQRWLADDARALHWFELALARRANGEEAAFRTALERLVARFPHAPEAGKARFLLEAE